MLLGHMERLVDAFSVTAIADSYFNGLRDHGYSHAYYMASFQIGLPPAIIKENPEIHFNFPEAFVRDLRSAFHLQACPWLEWAIQNRGTIILEKMLSETRGDSNMLAAADIAKQHGMASLRIISLKDHVARAHGLVAICPAPMADIDGEAALWKENHRQIRLLTQTMHMRMATIIRHSTRTELTQRQREVLEWTSSGKTVAEVATILGLTSATVEKHLRLARDTLDAGSTAQAILKAHVTNQIF